MVAPAELLRGHADQAAVGRDRRQRIAEAEAVGQENIGRTHAELLFIELLSDRMLRKNDSAEGMLGSLASHDAPAICHWPEAYFFIRS